MREEKTNTLNQLSLEQAAVARLQSVQEETKRQASTKVDHLQQELYSKETVLKKKLQTLESTVQLEQRQKKKYLYELQQTQQQMQQKQHQQMQQQQEQKKENRAMVIKLDEAVRVAKNAQAQCVQVEHELQQKQHTLETTQQSELLLKQSLDERHRTQMEMQIKYEAEQKRIMNSTIIKLQEDQKQEQLHWQQHWREEKEQTQRTIHQLQQQQQESQQQQDLLKRSLLETEKKKKAAEKTLQQNEWEMGNLKKSFQATELSTTQRKQATTSELQMLRTALSEQKSQLEQLTHSHAHLEQERNRVALELHDLKEGEERSLRESALVLESVRQGAHEFSNLLRGNSGSDSTTFTIGGSSAGRSSSPKRDRGYTT